jgi:hypothetical protein
MPAEEEVLHWIGGSNRRRDGYTYLRREPWKMHKWFARSRIEDLKVPAWELVGDDGLEPPTFSV